MPGPLEVHDQFDPARFFEHFPRFLETSETGPWLDRLNARYLGLIHANRELITGARVLDLASHDGRFSFAALQNGAARVVGIEHEPHLVSKANENMEQHGVDRDRYEFVLGDMFERIPETEQCDIVFCFGILYHINDHMRLLSTIAEFEPRTVIIDSNVSHIERAAIELRAPVAGNPPPVGAQLEGWPSKAGLDAMLSSFGWTFEYFDWPNSGLVDSPKMDDYRVGRRASAVVNCGDPVEPEVRARAVQRVFERQRERRTQWLVIVQTATEFGMTPQALAVWVRRAERLGPDR
ncbi:MAG TPA: methyltransferase domain-containing protein [Acidimicrobiia bacterium]|nr:methyltransferase domain-containing protein [Acidimicrobiia bacterium]